MEFKEYELGTIIECHDKERKPLSTIQRIKMKGQYPYYGAQEIIDYVEKYIFDGKYILLAEDGENLRSRIKPLLKIVNDKFWLNNHAHIFTCKEGYNLEYIYYALLKYDFQPYITGTTQPKLNQENMMKIKIKIPEIGIQNKISKILCGIDKKIELNNKINDNLYNLTVAIYKNKFQFTEQPECCVGDYLLPKRGKNLLSRDAVFGDVPVVAGGLEPATYHNISNTKAPVITISASGANAGYVSLWNIPVWSSDSSYIDNNITENIYFWYVTLKVRQKEIFDAQTGSAQAHIYPQHIAELPINKLNIDDVFCYEKEVTPFFKMIGENKKENKYLEQLRDTLLPKIMNGEIDIDKIEIW